MHIKRNIAAVLAAAAIAFPALAEGHENKTGFYAAPEIGRVKLKDYCGSIPSCEDSEIGYGLTAGYQFNEYFAVEAGGRFASGFDVSAVRRAPDGRGGFLTSTLLIPKFGLSISADGRQCRWASIFMPPARRGCIFGS